MDAPALAQLAKQYLVPLFSGARLEETPEPATARPADVAFDGPCNILFRLGPTDNYRLRIRRSQPFKLVGSVRITELNVVKAFVKIVREMERSLGEAYKDDLLATFQRRIVAEVLANDAPSRAIVLSIIDQMSSWSTRLYEGRPIASAIGFCPGLTGQGGLLKDICNEDFSAVLANGFDTILTCDGQGNLIGHETLAQAAATGYAPFRYGAIASWTTNNKVAVVLNRLGEILVFRDGELHFTRRSGRWHFLTHDPVFSQMGYIGGDVRAAVYESCLDASFARSGACIGVVLSRHGGRWKNVATSSDDYIGAAASVKTKALSKMIAGKEFQKLDRRLRQELMAIDGATILDHNGGVLSVGAILKLPGGSTGGGRRAASVELSKLGLGVKVSQDGSILGFKDGVDTPRFSLM